MLSLAFLCAFCACQKQDKHASHAEETPLESVDSFYLPVDYLPVDKEEIFTCVSEDGAMKFYSWNTGQGGTCPDYAVICQFRTKDGNVRTEDFSDREDMPAWVSAVHSLKKDDGTTYYIARRSHRASSNDGYMWIDGFIVDHYSLRQVSVYDAGDDLDECGMEINYVISDWYYTTNGEGWDWLFEYDAESRNLYVPQAVFIDEIIPTISDRYMVYHFNGTELEEIGESAHKNLHPSLCNYSRLASYFRTKHYLVRVDWLDEGLLRYASWKSTSDMSEKPDIMILGGKYDAEKETYTFRHEGYEYVVGYTEDSLATEGICRSHEFLLVRKGGKVVLKEKRVSLHDE